MVTISRAPDALNIETACTRCSIAVRGYVSGVQAGTFTDRLSGARELGFGLDIADFLLEPGIDTPSDLGESYACGDGFHGNIPKRYVALPQICTQARELAVDLTMGADFVAVRRRYQWLRTRHGGPGSHWEQTLVFVDGLRWFYAADRVVAGSASDALILRTDLPGHLQHQQGDTFSEIYLSTHGRLPAEAFLEDFPPDARYLYRRGEAPLPETMIRAYRARLEDGTPGPWLGGITLDPEAVYEAWCHQRGYVCFIQEIGGRPVAAGESFGAAYAIGWFDTIEAMQDLGRELRGKQGIALETVDSTTSVWRWIEAR